VTLYELLDEPTLESPAMIVALEGWIDAGLGASTAMSLLLETLETTTVARFDADALLDFRARRPTMHLVDGIYRGLTWPSTELRAAVDLDGNDILLLAGAEPDRRWFQFTREVADLAVHFGASIVIGIGAYPAPAPHTRAPLLACSSATPELAEGSTMLRATIDVPAGVQAAIERECADRGMPAIGLWAQVPHYAAAMPYPGASLALLEGVARMTDRVLPYGDLRAESDLTRGRLDELIQQNPEHLAMLRRLEEQADALFAEGELTLASGDDLAAELERFLRDQGS
jgi:hypothetical protein